MTTQDSGSSLASAMKQQCRVASEATSRLAKARADARKPLPRARAGAIIQVPCTGFKTHRNGDFAKPCLATVRFPLGQLQLLCRHCRQRIFDDVVTNDAAAETLRTYAGHVMNAFDMSFPTPGTVVATKVSTHIAFGRLCLDATSLSRELFRALWKDRHETQVSMRADLEQDALLDILIENDQAQDVQMAGKDGKDGE